MQIETIYRYPVKGLSPQPLENTVLEPDLGIEHDRRFAITHGASRFDRANPTWLPKGNFVMLARHERLAALKSEFDPQTNSLTIRRDGKSVVSGNLATPTGRMVVEQFLSAYLGEDIPGNPHIVDAPGHMFSDKDEKVISLVSTASLADLSRVARQAIDPRRFRPNIIFTAETPWVEFDWVGRSIRVGDAVLEVRDRIVRCQAVNVDPDTGERDLSLPSLLKRVYGHQHFGIYARVTNGGRIARGATVELI